MQEKLVLFGACVLESVFQLLQNELCTLLAPFSDLVIRDVFRPPWEDSLVSSSDLSANEWCESVEKRAQRV